MYSQIFLRVCGSSPSVGSSKNIILGRCMSPSRSRAFVSSRSNTSGPKCSRAPPALRVSRPHRCAFPSAFYSSHKPARESLGSPYRLGGHRARDPEKYADRSSNRIRFPSDIETSYLRGTLGWGEDRAQHVNQGCLPSSVWAEQPEEFALLYLKINVIDSGQAIELTG